jgi:rod shape determining protein RodA
MRVLVTGASGMVGRNMLSYFKEKNVETIPTDLAGWEVSGNLLDREFVFGKLAPYQQKRIITFINPDTDPLGAGYNVLQSKIAIGSGGLWGKGFLQGTQTQLNFIPAQWTDFIYCVPSEEFGFIGAFLILFLLTVLLYRGVQIAGSVKSSYASFVAIGVVATFAIHILINIGMSMGMVPVIGVPLPFLSYGGSNLITNMMMAGLLLNMYANRKEY